MLSVTYHQLCVISGAVFLSNSLIQDTSATTSPIDVSGIQQWSGYKGCSVQCNDGAAECSLSCRSWQTLRPSFYGCGFGQKAEPSSCCLTCQTFKVLYAMRSRGRTVYVLHQPWKGEWQLIPVGVCGNERKSSCRGGCITRLRAYPVKVADRPIWESRDLSAARTWYEWPNLPSYCICSSGGGAPHPPRTTTTTRLTTTTTTRRPPTRRRRLPYPKDTRSRRLIPRERVPLK